MVERLETPPSLENPDLDFVLKTAEFLWTDVEKIRDNPDPKKLSTLLEPIGTFFRNKINDRYPI